ncbi:methyl-accepting chemotaxis protein [Bacillus salitolerans]|uniref:Methyl-accepting chemotaxis protein n=1 Tax=Bacillus salitolerans TaxID=1437434 RepID=A0ABW4LUQ2_9BACI
MKTYHPAYLRCRDDVFRGHNPEKFGDNKSDKVAIQEALKDAQSSGFEFGSSGLAVRAFVPLKYNNKIIGTLQTGLNGSVVNEITQSQKGVLLNIINLNGEILVSSLEENLGNTLEANAKSMISDVTSGEEVIHTRETLVELNMPLYDPTKTEVIGVIQIQQDVTTIKSLNKSILVYLVAVGLATLLIVIVIAWFGSKGFTNPLVRINEVMKQISLGNLANKIDDRHREDEFGQLSKSIIETQSNLKSIIQNITDLSSTVKGHSLQMKQSFEEVNQGSNQVAITMQELSEGAELQAQSTGQLSEQMDLLSSRINQASQNGKFIDESTTDVIRITYQRKELMGASINQMKTINDIVLDAVQKVKGLDKLSKEMYKYNRLNHYSHPQKYQLKFS